MKSVFNTKIFLSKIYKNIMQTCTIYYNMLIYNEIRRECCNNITKLIYTFCCFL